MVKRYAPSSSFFLAPSSSFFLPSAEIVIHRTCSPQCAANTSYLNWECFDKVDGCRHLRESEERSKHLQGVFYLIFKCVKKVR